MAHTSLSFNAMKGLYPNICITILTFLFFQEIVSQTVVAAKLCLGFQNLPGNGINVVLYPVLHISIQVYKFRTSKLFHYLQIQNALQISIIRVDNVKFTVSLQQ